MGNKRNKHDKASAPIGVLLKDKTRERLTKTLKKQVPLSLGYTKEDFKELRTLLEALDWRSIEDTRKLTVLRNIWKATEEDTPQAAFQFMHSKKWGKVSKHAYEVMYCTTLEELPLKINEPLTYLLVKWRLSINK